MVNVGLSYFVHVRITHVKLKFYFLHTVFSFFILSKKQQQQKRKTISHTVYRLSYNRTQHVYTPMHKRTTEIWNRIAAVL